MHVLLLEAQILNQETEVCIQGVELLELTIFLVCLKLQLSCLNFLGCNLLFKLLDAIIEDEFELFQLLSLALQLVDLRFTLANSGILLSNLLV